MIVNVNPYDTGFDENSHVMKFSALAKDVMTVQKRVPPSSIPRLAPNTNHRRVTLSTRGKTGTRVTETHLDVLEGMSSCRYTLFCPPNKCDIDRG